MENKEKTFPNVGDELYLARRTGNRWCDMVKDPYTVIAVTKTCVTIQEAKPLFNGPRYFDSLADGIVADPNGRVLKLHWSPKRGEWQVDVYGTGTPSYAVFGRYAYQPYLN